MRKSTIILLILVAMTTAVQGQQRMQYSQYLQNAFLVNPAVGGVEPFMDVRTGYTMQWAGFKGAPKGGYISLTKGLFDPATEEKTAPTGSWVTSLPTTGRAKTSPTVTEEAAPRKIIPPTIKTEPNFHLGAGGTLFTESTGPVSISGIGGAFSGHVRLAKDLKLGVGAGLEMLNYRFNPNNFDLVNPIDVAFADNITNLLLPSINAGFALYHPKFFVAGSTRQLLQNRIQINDLNPVISNLEVHYMFQAGYRFKIGEDLSLTPSVIFRYVDPAPPSFDIAILGNYKNIVTGGFSYRHKDAIVGMVGIGITPLITAQYSFDFTLSNIRAYSAGTHSLVLGIKLGKNRSESRRYFW